MPELGTAAGPVVGALDEELGEVVPDEPVEPDVELEGVVLELPDDISLEDLVLLEPVPYVPDEPELLFIPAVPHAERAKAHARVRVHFNIKFS